jgi:hypothetical protein
MLAQKSRTNGDPASSSKTAALFAPEFPNIVIVPCTTALTFEVLDLCVQIEPDESNGFDRVDCAIAHDVTTASKARIVKETDYRVSTVHLAQIRAPIGETLGA